MTIRSGIFLTLLTLVTATNGWAQSNGISLRTVVIDPGHGGRDPGTVSPSGQSFEKSVNLAVALKLGKLIQNRYPDVTVLYTRTTDVLIPLDARADFANKNHADLFISIHANALANNTTVSGSETYVMGLERSASNMEVMKLENSVISYEEDYTSKYQGFDPNNPESYIIFNLLQNAHTEQSLEFARLVQDALGKHPITKNRGVQTGRFVVLVRTTMPSVLVELGYMSSLADRRVLITNDGQDLLAAALLKAFAQYKALYDQPVPPVLPTTQPTQTAPTTQTTQTTQPPQTTQTTQTTPTTQTTQTTQPPQTTQTTPPPLTTPTAQTTVYRVQIMAVSNPLPDNSLEFKGYAPVFSSKIDKWYKYMLGSFNLRQDAVEYCNRVVRKDFPQAFVVEINPNPL
ncbi:MAG: N-acetylmuramoyl-L-alanine amidase [Bacteroidetes bacterium]|nr:N-acetylmuramoyl-L-alanine amidase [Bacteroidota bacterium]